MKRLSPRELISLFQGLYTLLSAGLSLIDAITIQSKHHPKHLPALSQMILYIKQGHAFSVALKTYFHLPPIIMLSMRQSEAHGDLAQACAVAVSWLQDQESWKKLLWQLSFYPLLLLGTSVLLLCVMLHFVLPEFASLYETLNIDLPSSTAWLIDLADISASLATVSIVSICIFIVGSVIAWKQPGSRYHLEILALKLPGLKNLMLHHYEYQFSLQLGMLLKSGSGLLESIEIIRFTATSPVFTAYLNHSHQHIRQGQDLTHSLCHGLLQSDTYKVLLAHAQQTGLLDNTLLNLAAQHKATGKQWQEKSKHVLQPCITLLLGGFLGCWILLLYYPMLQLGTNLG